MNQNFIEHNVCSYNYPDYEQSYEVIGVYESWKKLIMDEPIYYYVYTETGENLDDKVWKNVPSRKDIREHYIKTLFK